MSGAEDTLQGYQAAMARLTPENPRQEADILASLAAFDALQAETRARAKAGPGWLARLLQPRALGLGGVVLASGLAAVVLLPQQGPHPDLGPGPAPHAAPPELRLALPRAAVPDSPVAPAAEPPQADSAAPAAADGRSALLMAAFTEELPQYFPLPWARDRVLALIATGAGENSDEILLATGGRVLVLRKPPPGLMGARGTDENYHRFAVGMAGLLQLQAGRDLGPDWDRARLVAELRQAAAGHAAREAALAAALGD